MFVIEMNKIVVMIRSSCSGCL